MGQPFLQSGTISCPANTTWTAGVTITPPAGSNGLMITELMLANGSTSYLAVDWTFNGNVPGPYIYANLSDSNGHTSVTGRKIFVPAGQTLTLMYNNGGSSSYSAGYYVTGYTV